MKAKGHSKSYVCSKFQYFADGTDGNSKFLFSSLQDLTDTADEHATRRPFAA